MLPSIYRVCKCGAQVAIRALRKQECCELQPPSSDRSVRGILLLSALLAAGEEPILDSAERVAELVGSAFELFREALIFGRIEELVVEAGNERSRLKRVFASRVREQRRGGSHAPMDCAFDERVCYGLWGLPKAGGNEHVHAARIVHERRDVEPRIAISCAGVDGAGVDTASKSDEKPGYAQRRPWIHGGRLKRGCELLAAWIRTGKQQALAHASVAEPSELCECLGKILERPTRSRQQHCHQRGLVIPRRRNQKWSAMAVKDVRVRARIEEERRRRARRAEVA